MRFAVIIIFILFSSCISHTLKDSQKLFPVVTGKPIQLYWSDLEISKLPENCKNKIMPIHYRALEVNYPYLRKILVRQGPNPGQLNTDTIALPFPMPEGSWEVFNITQVTVMAPELAAKFPEIKTYSGKSKDYPSDNVRLDISPQGVRAMIISTRGVILLDPYCANDTLYVMSYYKKDLPK